MWNNPKFARLVEAGNATGETIAVNGVIVRVRGLGEIAVGALVYFENGHSGLVREVTRTEVVILNLSAESLPLGTLVVLERDRLVTGVGYGLIGRVVSVLGAPLDGKGPLTLAETAPVFAEAPGIIERRELDDALPTGVAIVDTLFPFCLGQRMAVLGDGKTGKSAFTAQLSLAQKGYNRIVVHVLIGKRPADVDRLIAKLTAGGAMEYSIIVVAASSDSLSQSYLAPYVGAAIAEYLWKLGRDTIIIYDDLTSHAKIYRELSLLLRSAPGRDSYPGDMFYAHSSLLERAGRLISSGATLSALPIVLTPADDITAYLPTSIMSITDGQIIFDADSFRRGIRPAVNVGLSVSRVGGRAQTSRQQKLTGRIFKALAAYRQAEEFSRFGSELALESKADLELGRKLYEALRQPPDRICDFVEEMLILETVLRTEGRVQINIDAVKRGAEAAAPAIEIGNDAAIDAAVTKLFNETTIQPAAPKPSAPAPARNAEEAKK